MDSRETILNSIRQHLAASVPHNEPSQVVVPVVDTPAVASVVELFRENVEAVNGHCIIARNEVEVRQAVTQILAAHGAQRIAISDAPALNGLTGEIAPGAKEIFEYDVGITTVQAGIAETGTLVLDSARERHRLASLVPPVHIAIVNASSIFQTLAEALAFIHKDADISPAVTFITGPSRTADIELTLAIGVHGPQELYVIINDGPPSSH